ncbi:uncharacterized protein LOC141531874 [Cotesia typhae]|uniref:uncharacterized protein LOC141531874 n=1 Tax=Cotesia typhae TaxID=2053667 RepID=UPI003D69FC16
MKILIIFSILIGTVFYAKGQELPPPSIDDNECTYTGADCPDVPCCFPGYKCRLAGLSKYNPAFSKFSGAYNKTWKCLSQVNFGDPCQYDEECMHIENAKCIELTCQCEHKSLLYYPYNQGCH